MKLARIIAAGLLTITTLSGCGLNSFFDMGKRDTTQNQLCNRLKRDIMFYSMDQNHDTAWSSPAKQADILRQYQDNNCEAILNGSAEAKEEATESTPFSMPRGRSKNPNNVHVRQQS